MKIDLVIMKSEYMGLAWNFQVNPDSCGNHSHYENYIKFTAINDWLSGRGTTHAIVDNGGSEKKMIGYITLKATSLIKRDGAETLGDPALEIAELAVAKDAERNRYGSLLVQFAFFIAAELNNKHIGIRYITLCADNMAVPFYEKFGFKRVADYYEIPREGWNKGCVPMFIKLPDLPN